MKLMYLVLRKHHKSLQLEERKKTQNSKLFQKLVLDKFTNASNYSDNSNKPTKPKCCSFRLWLLIININSSLKCIHCLSCIICSLCRLIRIEIHVDYKSKL